MDEDREKGSVSLKLYWKYFSKELGLGWVFIIMLICIIGNIFSYL